MLDIIIAPIDLHNLTHWDVSVIQVGDPPAIAHLTSPGQAPSLEETEGCSLVTAAYSARAAENLQWTAHPMEGGQKVALVSFVTPSDEQKQCAGEQACLHSLSIFVFPLRGWDVASLLRCSSMLILLQDQTILAVSSGLS